jgi:hypothetical protein
MQCALESVLPQAGAVQAVVLSPVALKQFTDSGFVTMLQLCSERDLAEIRAILLALFERQTGRDEGNQFDMLGLDVDASSARQPQFIKPSIFAPELLHTEYFENLFTVARQLLGPDAEFSFDHSILKPARSAAATPWHQDEVHHPNAHLHYRQVSFWMPLQDTPLEAGCMRYIAGSNHGALLPHRRVDDDPRIQAVECRPEYVDESLAEAVPISAGSCIAHDGRTVHSALPNVSDNDRHAFIFAFTAPPVLAHEARAFTFFSKETENSRRRARWLRHGGFLVYGIRRLRQGLRSSPRAFWRKLKLRLRVAGLRAFR